MYKDLLKEIEDFLTELFSKEETWVILFIILGGGLLIFLPHLSLAKALFSFLRFSAWFWVFLILFRVFMGMWMFWRQQLFIDQKTPFVILEIIIPRGVDKTPKAMEQVLYTLHGLYNSAADVGEKYWDGEITRHSSLEMVSFGGEIHLYVRFYRKYRNLVEAAFFAHYPDIELTEVDDYTTRLPASVQELHAQGREMWGTELILTKEPLYPIRSYIQFTEVDEEGRKVDPMSAFLETLGNIKKSEFMGIQIILIPLGPDWRKGCEKGLDELKIKTAQRPALSDEEGPSFSTRTPGDIELLRAVEGNLTKPAFDTLIRHIYFSPFEDFVDSVPRRGVRAAFNQYSSVGLNAFRDNFRMSTLTKIWVKPYVFPRIRNNLRKQRLLMNMITRNRAPTSFYEKLITSHILNWNFWSKHVVLTTESMATLFHIPTGVVLTAPHVKRAESRRAGPPMGLPIYGDEELIERYSEK